MRHSSKMIHISVSVKEPRKCAETLAELTDGKAEVFSPLANSYVCLWGSWEGSSTLRLGSVQAGLRASQFIEFYPAGTELLNTPEGCDFGRDNTKGGSHGIHVAIEVLKPLSDIQKIADKHKCPHRGRPQGGGPVYEVWLDEGKLLIELVSDEIRRMIQ